MNTMLLSRDDVGLFMYELARRLFPICRSLTGQGVRQSLDILREHLPSLQIHEVPSGTRCFDWTVPDEWNICDAYILCPDGSKIAKFSDNNLHIVGYSEPVDKELELSELQRHLHSLPTSPDSIPYVTSYYQRRWGFCISEQDRSKLQEGSYRAMIDSTLTPGFLSYADLVLPGTSTKEVLISTYICHPSLANNELSGPVVATRLAMWMSGRLDRRYTYRFVFVPETIGSILYIQKHLDHLKTNVIASFNVSCVGDDRTYSFLPSRHGNTLSDRIAKHILKHRAPGFNKYTYLQRGSDERQYCAPGVDLPISSIMRSKYGCYPEYHTSKDDLNLISPGGLTGGYEALRDSISAIEADRRYITTVLCEPQMGKRGLYSTLGARELAPAVETRMNLLAYCDGRHSLLEIAELLNILISELYPFIDELEAHNLIREVEH